MSNTSIDVASLKRILATSNPHWEVLRWLKGLDSAAPAATAWRQAEQSGLRHPVVVLAVILAAVEGLATLRETTLRVAEGEIPSLVVEDRQGVALATIAVVRRFFEGHASAGELHAAARAAEERWSELAIAGRDYYRTRNAQTSPAARRLHNAAYATYAAWQIAQFAAQPNPENEHLAFYLMDPLSSAMAKLECAKGESACTVFRRYAVCPSSIL